MPAAKAWQEEKRKEREAEAARAKEARKALPPKHVSVATFIGALAVMAIAFACWAWSLQNDLRKARDEQRQTAAALAKTSAARWRH